MKLTSRDNKILDFLKVCPANSSTLQKLYFPSIRMCNERMRKLFTFGYVKRTRNNVNEYYLYYIQKKPKQIEHCNYISKCYLWILSQGYTIEKFKREVSVENIRADALCKIIDNIKSGYLFVEVELSRNNINNKISKYEQIYINKTYTKYFDTMPKILYISNQSVKSSILDIIYLKPNQLLNC